MKNGMKAATVTGLTLAMGLANSALAFEPGDWLVRVGAMNVDPKSDNHLILSVDDDVSATFGFTYMMTDIWAIDVLAAAPFEHNIDLMMIDPDDGSLNYVPVGSTKQLPPTVSLQWRPMPNSRFQPYVGVGINYTNFFSEKGKGLLEDVKLDLGDSWGAAIQAGFDITLGDNVFLNFDVRYANIETKVKVNGVNLGPVLDATLDLIDPDYDWPAMSGTVKIDPMVYGAHIGFRF